METTRNDTNQMPWGPDYEPQPSVPQEIPEQTWWPVMTALGLFFFFLGIVTTWIISIVGAVILGISFAGWIGDLNHG